MVAVLESVEARVRWEALNGQKWFKFKGDRILKRGSGFKQAAKDAHGHDHPESLAS